MSTASRLRPFPMQVASLTAQLGSAAQSSQDLQGQLQSAEHSQRELRRQVEEGERSREEMQGAAQQAKAADVQVKALQARLTQATEATSTIGKDLAQARTQVHWQILRLDNQSAVNNNN